MTRLLIDTNRYTDIIRGDQHTLHLTNRADQLYLPFISLAELHAGFRSGSRHGENEKRLKQFLSQPAVGVLYPDEPTIEVFADLKTQLRRQGTPIPDHDIWIAALALQHGLTLLTRDKHFDAIVQLKRA